MINKKILLTQNKFSSVNKVLNFINSKKILLLIFFVSILLVGCGNAGTSSDGAATFTSVESPQFESPEYQTVSKGSTEMGDALIELTPSYAEGNLNVDIRVNTHSVALSEYDLLEVMTLEYDGNVLSPISAVSLSGHHSSGTVVFETGKKPIEFTIRIADIPKNERVFIWS